MTSKILYYLSPSKYYYDYAIEREVAVSLAFPKGIYVKAYSIKQAIIYVRRRIAEYVAVPHYDIDVDIHDIEIIEK